MKKKLTLLFALILTLVAVFSGCEKSLKISAEDLATKYSRKANDVCEVTEEFSNGIASFGVELFKETLVKDGENKIISPTSAIYCLALLANGADGDTLSEMEEVFGVDINALNKGLYAFKNLPQNDNEECKLTIANSLWIKNGLPVKEGFLQTNADYLDAQVYDAPFNNKTVKDVNDWCDFYTDGAIKKILEEISNAEVMFLINALYFDAKWAVKYENNDVKDGKFTNQDGSASTVDYLYSNEYGFIEGENYTGFAKNYKGNNYSFVGLLPNEGVDIYDFIDSFNCEEFLESFKSRLGVSTKVKFPEFSYESSLNLTQHLENMGMDSAFDPFSANFSKMSDDPLFCAYVKQSVFIDVSRNGTKAAAITWGDMPGSAAPPEKEYKVYLDRPFMYMIVNNATGIPLFIGNVTKL